MAETLSDLSLTPTRRDLLADVAAGYVWHYPAGPGRPAAVSRVKRPGKPARQVTATVAEFVIVGWVTLDPAEQPTGGHRVLITTTGRAAGWGLRR